MVIEVLSGKGVFSELPNEVWAGRMQIADIEWKWEVKIEFIT